MNAQTAIKPATIYSAMAAAFAEIEGATKDRENPAFKQGGRAIKYADLTAVIEAIKPALVKNELFFVQRPQPSEHGVTIETIVCHSSGEQMSLGTLFVPANKNDAQGYGSALTYARRYALVTAFGVPVEDDDGNAATRDDQAPVPTPAEMIARDDVTKMIMLCDAIGGNQVQLICDGYKVSALPELTVKQGAGAIKRLNEKLEERKKELAHV